MRWCLTGLALEQFGYRERDAPLAPNIVDGQNVRMGERYNRPGFALETRQRVGVFRDRLRQYLDSHLTPEPRVPGAIDSAHPTRPDGCRDLIRDEAKTGDQRHTVAVTA